MKMRFILLLLAFLLCGGVLCACNPADTPKPPVDNPDDPSDDDPNNPNPPACTEHTDADKDGLCDTCGETVEPDDPNPPV